MVNSEYSPYKIVHHLDRLNTIKATGTCIPISIHLAPTTYCNCSCYYCYVKDCNKELHSLDKSVLFSFLKDAAIAGVKAVEITGGGEPTLYPYFDELLYHCHNLGLDIGIISNGYHLNPDFLKYAKWLRISIDSFDDTVYSQIKGTHLPDLSCIKQLSDEYGVITGASCVLNKYNYNAINDFVSNAKRLGFRNVWFKGVEGSKELDDYRDEIKKALDEIRTLSNDRFKVFIGELFRNTESQSKPFERCCFQHVALMLYADGNIYPCCSLQGRKQFAITNIYNESFSTVMNKRRELSVSECPLNCFWENKNVLMEYIILDNPQHVNFM